MSSLPQINTKHAFFAPDRTRWPKTCFVILVLVGPATVRRLDKNLTPYLLLRDVNLILRGKIKPSIVCPRPGASLPWTWSSALSLHASLATETSRREQSAHWTFSLAS